MNRNIEDYAIIGNTLTAALVARDGAIDWLCMPCFDSPACFAALLGTAENGHWMLAPRESPRRLSRRYRDGTLILETRYDTESGSVELIDFMPLPRDEEVADLVRIVRGLRGTVPMRFELRLRCDYGHVVPWVRRREDGLSAIAGPEAIYLSTPVELRGEDMRTVAEFTVSARQTIACVLTRAPSHKPAPRPCKPLRALEETEQSWRAWSARCTGGGPWREQILRSAITLKALTHSPTGGIVAAATTSLPEKIGGVRNWDYRYCWLRDAAFTLYALLIMGFQDEARAWGEWLRRAVAGEPSKLQIMYSLKGERRLAEQELPWLRGYADSRPVRIGNGAHGQRQMDIYGEVMDAFHVGRIHGVATDEDIWRIQLELMNFLEQHWHEPGSGVWEQRGDERHYTYSKVMGWVAADRAVKAVERFGLDGPAERWRALRQAIHEDVCANGFDRRRNAFMQTYRGDSLDASLLLVPLVGFLPPRDPRVIGTMEAIQRELVSDGLVMRYRAEDSADGLPPGEGTFIACSFWLADNLAMTGRTEEAVALFERVLRLANDVGLLAEQYDPREGRQLGNFPQAFSHVGMINTAMNLAADPRARRASERHQNPEDTTAG